MKRTSGCGCKVAVDAGVTPMPVDAAIAIGESLGPLQAAAIASVVVASAGTALATDVGT